MIINMVSRKRSRKYMSVNARYRNESLAAGASADTRTRTSTSVPWLFSLAVLMSRSFAVSGFHPIASRPTKITINIEKSKRWTRIYQTRTEQLDENYLVSSSTTSSSVLDDISYTSHDVSSQLLPPWLERFQSSRPEQVQLELYDLELALSEHGFALTDVRDIKKAILLAAAGDVPKIIGCIAFCKTLLKLEDEAVGNISSFNIGNDNDSLGNNACWKNDLVTKDVVLASILHYTECVTARYEGVYETVQAVIGSCSGRKRANRVLEPSRADEIDKEEFCRSSIVWDDSKTSELLSRDDEIFSSTAISVRTRLRKADKKAQELCNDNDLMNIFSAESLRLAQSASRIKRAEILASVSLSDGRSLHEDVYSDIRDLLVSLSDDWRALAIRCVASLYRLEGIVASTPQGTGEFIKHRSQEITFTAKDSLRVYATLAQRLGLHRLKIQLEANAFRILYPRQFLAASTLFYEHGAAMKAISTYLSNEANKLLSADLSLMYELEDLQVVARVKEPYSFWKKILKKRLVPNMSADNRSTQYLIRSAKELSVLEVNDGVALRVILKARKIDEDESDETTRSREIMLCYYVQQLVRSQWPEIDASRVKDYIRNPKENGYQSLHHTSKITRNGQDFFFEIQIRSQEMHQLAEFGVAAHWSYKLSSRNYPALSGPSAVDHDGLSFAPGDLSTAGALSSMENEETVLNSKTLSREEQAESISAVETRAYINAMQESRRNLMETHVYVFLSGSCTSFESGQLLTLSAGSLVRDVLSYVEQEENPLYKDGEICVWKNGKLALMEEVVKNGDMLLIEPALSSSKDGRNRKSPSATVFS